MEGVRGVRGLRSKRSLIPSIRQYMGGGRSSSPLQISSHKSSKDWGSSGIHLGMTHSTKRRYVTARMSRKEASLERLG